jgi:hypothetical protein
MPDRIPYNEFSEQFTADFKSEDTMMFYMMNPQESDCPEAAQKQKEWWKAGCPKRERVRIANEKVKDLRNGK